MATDDPENASYHRLCDHLRPMCWTNGGWLSSVGIGAKRDGIDVFHVYAVRKPQHHERQPPTEWEGHAVEFKIAGMMRLN
jgi:hypothetical protein